MIEFLLGVNAAMLILILWHLVRIGRETQKDFAAFRGELKGYLLDMYAEMIKKDN